MLLLVHAFVAAAAHVLQLKVSTGSIKEVAEKIIEKFVHLPSVSSSEQTEFDDMVHLYATEVISLGLIWHGVHDAIKEGDGDRILRYWKIFLINKSPKLCQGGSEYVAPVLLHILRTTKDTTDMEQVHKHKRVCWHEYTM